MIDFTKIRDTLYSVEVCHHMDSKNSSVSEQTKQQLAAALKTLMAQKPMDKITISELTAHCKIRRQSFYYHFEDIYDLKRWMIQSEAISRL